MVASFAFFWVFPFAPLTLHVCLVTSSASSTSFHPTLAPLVRLVTFPMLPRTPSRRSAVQHHAARRPCSFMISAVIFSPLLHNPTLSALNTTAASACGSPTSYSFRGQLIFQPLSFSPSHLPSPHPPHTFWTFETHLAGAVADIRVFIVAIPLLALGTLHHPVRRHCRTSAGRELKLAVLCGRSYGAGRAAVHYVPDSDNCTRPSGCELRRWVLVPVL